MTSLPSYSSSDNEGEVCPLSAPPAFGENVDAARRFPQNSVHAAHHNRKKRRLHNQAMLACALSLNLRIGWNTQPAVPATCTSIQIVSLLTIAPFVSITSMVSSRESWRTRIWKKPSTVSKSVWKSPACRAFKIKNFLCWSCE